MPNFQWVFEARRTTDCPGVQARSLPEWSELISELLGAMGWPGDTSLTVRKEPIIDQWKEQLSTLSGLGLVSPAVTFEHSTGNSAAAAIGETGAR